jgi:hypothetical protein
MAIASGLRAGRSRTRSVAGLTVVVVAVLVLLLTSSLGVRSASVGSTLTGAAPATVRSDPLVAASRSLALGQGPAAGTALRCSPTTGATAVCQAPSLAPHPATGSGRVWTDLTKVLGPNAPASRWIAEMAYDPVDRYVVLFGGDNESLSNAYSDTWAFSNGAWTQLYPTLSPEPRYAATMTWDAADGYLVLFGGHDYPSGIDYNNTWTFVHGTWTNVTSGAAPAARWRASMAYDPVDGFVVLFGGTDTTGATIYHDTWKYLAGKWTDISSNVTGSPPGRYRASMVWDPADKEIVLFGGCTTTCPTADTYTFVNGTWTKASPTTSPSARVYVGLTYDAAVGAVLLFGGATGSSLTTGVSDTWKYSGGTWTNLAASPAPSTRAYVAMAYDPLDNFTLLFGGANPAVQTTVFGDTWVYGPSVIGSFSAQPATLDVNQTTILNGTPLAASGWVSYTYASLPPGCVSQNTSTLSCRPTAAGVYDVELSLGDAAGIPVNKSINLTVNGDPAIAAYSVTPNTVTAGTAIQFNVTAAGGTGGLNYAYSGLPPGCVSANRAVLACTPSGAASGPYSVEAIVWDGVNFHVFANTSVTVNARPGIAAFLSEPATIDEGQTVIFSVNVTGGTLPLSFQYLNLPTGCTSADTARLTCTPTATGSYSVAVNVSDAFGTTASAMSTVTINADPTIDALVVLPPAIDIGGSLSFYLNASGGTGTLATSWSGLPAGCNLGVAPTGSCTPVVEGTFNITGTVRDRLAFTVTKTVQVAVGADPQITGVTVTPAAIDAGQNLTIHVAAAGGTAPFTFVYVGLPVGCQGVTTATVTCRPHTSGTYTFTAEMTDAWKQSAQLPGSLIVNTDPSIASFAVSSSPVAVGSATVLSVGVAGGSGVYSYEYSGLPSGCLSSNTSSLRCVPTTAGTYNVTVTVTDSLGVQATGSTNVTVQSAGGSGTVLGLAAPIGWAVIGVIVLLLVVVAALLLMRRRRAPPAPAEEPEAPAAWDEAPPDETPPA